MSFVEDLLEKPAVLSAGSKYAVINGIIYLALGLLFIVWPGVVQTVFMDRAFVGDEQGLIRVMGLTVIVIGWLYVFGVAPAVDSFQQRQSLTDWFSCRWCSCLWRSLACSLTCSWRSRFST
jgi:cytochrome c biogenesis protein CcdA